MTTADHSTITAAVWDGPALLAALRVAADALTRGRDQINALNVFPVPDGDTGTNMALTLRAAVDEAVASTGGSAPVSLMADRIAYGALLGARGNSGVILSQILRGFAKALGDADEMDGRDLARALAGARDTAYKAVMKPVEGTMLTVIRVAAERAETSGRRSPLLAVVLDEALAGAREALADTPRLLDILRQANVVDAGGQGIVVLLDAVAAFAHGREVADEVQQPISQAASFDALAGAEHGEGAFGYCTNFMIAGAAIPYDRVRAEIGAMGESAVIVGDQRLVKVHIHTEDPGSLLTYAVRWGELSQIKIDNMNLQTQALARGEPVTGTVAAPTGVAVVAVAAGDGVADVMRSLGATAIVTGGQTMNPSIQDLLSAVEGVTASSVVVLPNNGNIVLAANQLPGLSGKDVRVVPTKSVPQGLAALTAYLVDRPLDANADAMREAARAVRSVEVTSADKDATIDGVSVRRGQVIGIVDDVLVVAGDDLIAVAVATLAHAQMETAEVVTVLVGRDAEAGAGERLQAAIQESRPELDVEVVDGGQPHYDFLIAVE